MTKYVPPSKALILIWCRNQKLQDKQRIKKFSITKPASQKILKDRGAWQATQSIGSQRAGHN